MFAQKKLNVVALWGLACPLAAFAIGPDFPISPEATQKKLPTLPMIGN